MTLGFILIEAAILTGFGILALRMARAGWKDNYK